MQLACEPDFDVLAESDDWIAVSKAAPLIVHPTDKKGQATLLCGLQQLLAYEIVNGVKLSIINRLDRETSGVVLVAKHKSAARAFNRAMERREVAKGYLAIMDGQPEWEEVVVDQPIGNQRDEMESAIWLKQRVMPSGRESVTKFNVLQRYEGFCLVRVSPKTGRMHQIRVHAQWLGHPLVGDKIYGPNERFYLEHIESGWSASMASKLMLPRQALHAESLKMQYGEVMLKWHAPLADDLVQFLSRYPRLSR